jgi:hypothetical protein
MVAVMGVTFVISGGLAAGPMGGLLAAEAEAGEAVTKPEIAVAA